MDIGEAAVWAQIAWFRLLAGSGFPRLELAGGLAVASGLHSNTENGAVLDPRSEAAPALRAWLTVHDLPASVLLTAVADAQTVAHLNRLGLEPENGGNEMGADLSTLRLPVGDPPDIRITEVTEGRDLADAFGIFDDADWFTNGELPRRIAAAQRIGYGPGSPVRHWVARAGKDPVGAATSFTCRAPHEPVVTLAHCCVAQPYRRRGIGTALTRARIAAAHHDGVQWVVLSPSPDGYQLHRTFGFATVPTPHDRWFYLR